MGSSISWLAFSGKNRAEVLDMLHLQDNGAIEEYPQSPISSVSLPGDWTIVFLNKLEHPFAEDASLASFSKDCKLMAVHVEEHVMFSSARLYANGKMTWSVFHEAERGMYDIQTEGTPPPAFYRIRDELLAQQRDDGGENSDVDYIFDVPLELAATLCGFKHDQKSPAFSVLRDRNGTQ